MQPENYFDYAASGPVDPRVLEAMLPYFSEQFGNPASVHSWGLEAANAVERSRDLIAHCLGAEDPSQIVFVSGATEANNLVLRQHRFAVSPFDHSSVMAPAAHLGYSVLTNDGYALSPGRDDDWLTAVLVCSETGAIPTLPDTPHPIHRDITQAVGRVPIDLEGIDFASFSGHKIGAPKGIGALYLKDPSSAQPVQFGGHHEQGLRAGTLNVPGIIGLSRAVQIVTDELDQRLHHAQTLRNLVLDELRDLSDWTIDPSDARSPHILSVSFEGILGETLVLELDAQGYGISSGAACSAFTDEPSAALTALGYSPNQIRGTVRISFGPANTAESAVNLARTLRNAAEKLRKSHKSIVQ